MYCHRPLRVALPPCNRVALTPDGFACKWETPLPISTKIVLMQNLSRRNRGLGLGFGAQLRPRVRKPGARGA
eukprot:192517-Pyramimonas_sp.AAC.1